MSMYCYGDTYDVFNFMHSWFCFDRLGSATEYHSITNDVTRFSSGITP